MRKSCALSRNRLSWDCFPHPSSLQSLSLFLYLRKNMKYWNAKRIRRKKEEQRQREARARQQRTEHESRKHTYTKGDVRKNARLMLDAIGKPLHRRMLARLRAKGAMSVTHLAEPFGIRLPDAMRHVHILERAGLITTEKRGRIRFCVYNPAAARELSAWLSMGQPFDLG